MNIALDMMGGDFSPLEAIKGISLYLQNNPSPEKLLLTGDEVLIKKLLDTHNISYNDLIIIHAPQVIEMHEHPTKALKEKQQSSIAIGFKLLAEGKADAFISAGNTGAMMVGALFSIKA